MRAASYTISWSKPLDERRTLVREWTKSQSENLREEIFEFLSWTYQIEVEDEAPERHRWFWREFLDFSKFDPEESSWYSNFRREEGWDYRDFDWHDFVDKGRFVTLLTHNDGDRVIASTVPGDEKIYESGLSDRAFPIFQNVCGLVEYLTHAFNIGYCEILEKDACGMYSFRPLREFAARRNPSIEFWREDHQLIWDWPQGSTNRPGQ